MFNKLNYLQEEKNKIEAEIAHLEKLQHKSRQDFKAEQIGAKRSLIQTEIDNRRNEIIELYDKIDEIDNQIYKIETSTPKLPSNNKEDNPKNQQELKFDECLCKIDFKQAMKIFNKIQEQFDDDGDVALFFLEEYLIKRGDLFLIRLRDIIKPEQYRSQFSHWQFEYKFSDFKSLINRIAEKNGIKKQDINIKVLIDTIGNSLQNDSILFIEIYCDIDDESEIKNFISRFIQDFWQPLRQKITQVTEEFEGIKVITIVKCDQSEISLSESLSCYFNDQNEYDCFVRDKLVKIPLESWTQNDIYEWLRVINPSLKKSERKDIASKIYRGTKGFPNTIYYGLQQKWQNLITLPTSC